MGFFRRIFKVAQSEAHSVVDRFEDPIKMTEQGIRDLKDSLKESLQGLAQVKAVVVRLRQDLERQRQSAAEYERKAVALLQRAQSGDLDQADADRLAGEALARKAEAQKRAQEIGQNYERQNQAAEQLQAKVEQLKHTIRRYENELVTLQARAKTAKSMTRVNQQLAGVDTSSTVAMLEKMKQRVEQEEALAQAYGDIGTDIGGEQDLDAEIAQALGPSTDTATQDSLADLKRKLGMASGASS